MRLEPALELAARIGRRALAGPGAEFRFRRPDAVRIPRVERTGLYVHVPFCRSLCPYCPYTRIPYAPALVEPFVDGIAREAAHYAAALPGVEVTSVYVGGGTPTVLGPALERVLDGVRRAFRVTGPICVETHPAELTRGAALALRSAGVAGMSLGVESFHPRLLALLGRRYAPEDARRALEWLGEAGFPTVNVDLMFALPTETDAELAEDVAAAASTCAGQITAYPLFTFPYTSVGRYRALRGVESPPFRTRRRMSYLLTDALEGRGFRRASVWSFQRTPPETPRFSSVTRERYVGLGPGAGSFYGDLFTLNTFSGPAWRDAVRTRGQAVALEMPFSRRLSVLYDFYWRLYDTVVPARRSVGALSYAVEEEPGLGALLRVARLLGLASRTADGHVLTRRGALFVHFAQNLVSLPAIDRIWTRARREAWPAEIAF